MSKFTNRPMSEYESACFDLISVVLSQLVDDGVNIEKLRGEIDRKASRAREQGASNGAAAMDYTARFIADRS